MMSEFNNIDLKAETKKEYEDLPLTLQIMHELRMSSQRWFIIAMAELVVILIMIAFIFIVPAEETSTVTQDLDTDNSYGITQTIGE